MIVACLFFIQFHYRSLKICVNDFLSELRKIFWVEKGVSGESAVGLAGTAMAVRSESKDVAQRWHQKSLSSPEQKFRSDAISASLFSG